MQTHTFSLRMIKRFFRHYFGCLPQKPHYISSREYWIIVTRVFGVFVGYPSIPIVSPTLRRAPRRGNSVRSLSIYVAHARSLTEWRRSWVQNCCGKFVSWTWQRGVLATAFTVTAACAVACRPRLPSPWQRCSLYNILLYARSHSYI